MFVPASWLVSVLLLKVVSGNLRLSREKEAPFVVSIRRTEFEQNFGFGHHHCSGALIDTTTVVTAASCLYDTLGNAILEPKSFTVVAGTRYLIASSPDDHGVIRECDRIIQHPHFDPVDHSNDIAYMKIVIPFDTTSGDVRPIALTDAVLDRDTICKTYGWGWMNESDTLNPPMKVQYSGSIQIASKSVCSAKFDKFDIELQADKVCAQVSHDKNDCRDLDAGGILVCFSKLVGVVSIYSDCSLYDYPTVFTHTSSHSLFLNSRKDVMGSYYSPAIAVKALKFFYYFILVFILERFTY